MRIDKHTILLLVLLGFGFVAACAEDPLPPLVASDVELTSPMPGHGMSAAYLALTNNTGETITITHVSSPDFEAVELHESTLEDGVAKMRPVAALSIPPRTSVTLARGGLHLMLMRATGTGEQVTLNFMHEDTLLLGVSTPLAGSKQ